MKKKKKNTEKVQMSRKTDFFRNPKKCVFRKFSTDFENRLKHQVSIILSAFLDFDLLVHILLSNVSPFCNLKFPSISHTSSFGAKIQVPMTQLL